MAGYEGFEVESTGDLKQLVELVREMRAAEDAVKQAEADLKKRQAAFNQLQQFDIPAAMDDIGVESVTVDGMEVRIEKKIRASIGSRKVEAFRWLSDHGHGSLIKRTLRVDLGRDSEDEASDVMEALAASGHGEDVAQDFKVEPATLLAFVKEELAAGRDVPREVFGVMEQRFAKVANK